MSSLSIFSRTLEATSPALSRTRPPTSAAVDFSRSVTACAFSFSWSRVSWPARGASMIPSPSPIIAPTISPTTNPLLSSMTRSSSARLWEFRRDPTSLYAFASRAATRLKRTQVGISEIGTRWVERRGDSQRSHTRTTDETSVDADIAGIAGCALAGVGALVGPAHGARRAADPCPRAGSHRRRVARRHRRGGRRGTRRDDHVIGGTAGRDRRRHHAVLAQHARPQPRTQRRRVDSGHLWQSAPRVRPDLRRRSCPGSLRCPRAGPAYAHRGHPHPGRRADYARARTDRRRTHHRARTSTHRDCRRVHRRHG